jgi:hypothetical protein
MGEPDPILDTYTAEKKVHGVVGMLGAYHRAVHGTEFAGPTYLAGILDRFHTMVLEEMKKKERLYFVLVLLSDGCLHDMQDTLDIVVKLSFLPVSIIIIGIGNEDFSKMELLDADRVVLEDRNGRAA